MKAGAFKLAMGQPTGFNVHSPTEGSRDMRRGRISPTGL
jgi:hypothetical protein